MALGGFKFSGRVCHKGELSLEAWVDLQHRTKVAAFLAANDAAGAGWEVDGDDLFVYPTGYAGNVISFFKHPNSGSYFAIYTLGRYTDSTSPASGYVSVTDCRWQTWYTSSSNTITSGYFGNGCSSFFRFGKISIKDVVMGSVNGVSPILPTSNTGSHGSTWSNQSSFTSSSTVLYCGFAVRGADIISFIGDRDPATKSLGACLVSGDAFTTMFNGNDREAGLYINFQTQASSSGTSCYETTDLAYSQSVVPFAMDFYGASLQNNLPIMYAAPAANFNGSVQQYPLEAIAIGNIANSESGISTKGIVNIELFAVNFPKTRALSVERWQTFGGGNYLCVYNSIPSASNFIGLNWNYTSVDDKAKNCVNYYCGWDPSNPDITQASAWTEYASGVPQSPVIAIGDLDRPNVQ